jgi:threonine dehydrogenase-like Zn-dependent dehydrogenase
METARYVVQTEVEKYEVREAKLPPPARDGGILQVETCGICGTDAEIFRGQLAAPLPIGPGHEAVGRVVALGAEARRSWGIEEGARIAVSSKLACGRCPRCVRGERCAAMPGDRLPNYGFQDPDGDYPLSGGFATHMVLAPQTELTVMPESVPSATASLFNAMMAGWQWTIDTGELRPLETVLIMGPGSRGLACLVAALQAGASFVAVSGLTADRRRLALARKLGAHLVATSDTENVVDGVRRATDGRGVDVVIDCTPAPSAVGVALDAVARGGRIVLAGIKGGDAAAIDNDRIVFGRVDVRGVSGRSIRAMDRAIQLLQLALPGVEEIATDGYRLDDAAEAVRCLSDPDPQRRPVHARIVPGLG